MNHILMLLASASAIRFFFFTSSKEKAMEGVRCMLTAIFFILLAIYNKLP